MIIKNNVINNYSNNKDFKDSELVQKHLEFSNFPKDHSLYNNDRMKIPGIYQDESIR